jgi:hypothetical protein
MKGNIQKKMNSKFQQFHSVVLIGLLTAFSIAAMAAPTYHAPKPVKPPKGAIILFDGKNTDAWEQLGSHDPCKWDVVNNTLQVVPGTGNIITKENFGDYHLHVEFMEPYLPDKHSQERGNSGVYNQGQYEIQVLDSYENPTYKNGSCGSIYGLKEPDKNVARPPLEWQTYDIFFKAPRFDDSGKVIANPRITLIWNGVKVHNNVEITCGPTTASMGGDPQKEGPIMLQDHGSKVQYRDIWIQKLK